MSKGRSYRSQFILALAISSLVSVGLFTYGALRNHSMDFGFMCWNLALAWLPLLFAFRLTRVLKHKLWSSWEALSWSVLWILFLPNSFYIITDFIHLQDVRRVDLLYDAIMFTSFVYTGVLIGFTSLYLVHLQLKRRLSPTEASSWIAGVLFLSSGAIYVGRDLRWNSWDVLTNPGGLLFDISDRLIHTSSYPQMVITVIAFFVLLGSMYNLFWRGAIALQHADK